MLAIVSTLYARQALYFRLVAHKQHESPAVIEPVTTYDRGDGTPQNAMATTLNAKKYQYQYLNLFSAPDFIVRHNRNVDAVTV